MSYDVRTYEDVHRDPVVVLVVTGQHDVSRLVNMLADGNCEQGELSRRIIAGLKRHNAGRAALALLKAHGGADFTDGDDLDTTLVDLRVWLASKVPILTALRDRDNERTGDRVRLGGKIEGVELALSYIDTCIRLANGDG